MRKLQLAKQVRLDQAHAATLRRLSQERGVNASTVLRCLIVEEGARRGIRTLVPVTTIVRGVVRCPVCWRLGSLALSVTPGSPGERWEVGHTDGRCDVTAAQAVDVLRAVS